VIGGGSYPRPGEVSLAHGGVLFLDELPEFRKNVLEVLRQPMEDGSVTLSRAITTLTFPARFMLAAAMNPCPCGFHGDTHRPCVCTPATVQHYSRASPGRCSTASTSILEVPAVRFRELTDSRPGEPSEAIRARVAAARSVQQERFRNRRGVHANAHMTPRDIRACCRLTEAADALLRTAIARLRPLSPGVSPHAQDRAHHRRLAGAPEIEPAHVSEAVQYRGLDRAGRIAPQQGAA